MAEQDPPNLNHDKFTVTLKDGATHTTDILTSLQTGENQTITQNSLTSPTLPHTRNDAIINAEAAPSSILFKPDDTVTPQDTALSASYTAHDVSMSSMTPPAPFTLDSDPASMIADSNQASESLSQLLDDSGADTKQTKSHRKSSSMDNFDGYSDEVSEQNEDSGNQDFRSLTYRSKLDNAQDENRTLKHELKKAENKITRLKNELDKGKTEITNITSPNPELDKAKTEITNLKFDVRRHAKDKSELEKTVNTLTSDNSSLRKQVSASEFKIEKLERGEKKLRRELEEAKDQRNGNNGDMEGLEAMVYEQAQSLESKDVLLKKLQKDVLDKDLSINHANEENERLRKEISTLEQRSRTQTGQVRGDAKKLTEAQNELKRLENQHEKTMKDLRQQVERLTMRVQAQPRTKMAEMKEEFAATLEVNARMENEIEVLRTEMSGLETELHKVKARADKAQEKLKKWGEKNKDTKKVEPADEKTEIPLETPVKQEEGATDVPTVERLATSVSNEPVVTVTEEPKLPSADAEAKEQGSKADVSKLREPKRENGQTSLTFSSALASITARASVASDHHKQGFQEADPFTEAHVSLERPTTPHDKEHDNSNSSVCSTTELSIDNRTPRALRRTLGQEGIQSRAQSTATDFSVTKCDEWIHRTNNYVEKGVQTDSLRIMENMGAQTDPVPMKLMENMGMQTDSFRFMKNMGAQTDPVPMKLMENMGMQTDSFRFMKNMGAQTDPVPMKLMENMGMQTDSFRFMKNMGAQTDPVPMKLMENMGVQTDPIPEKLMENMGVQTDPIPEKLMENMGVQTDPIPEKLIPEKLMENMGVQTDDVPMKLMENMGVQTDPVPVKLMENMGVQTDHVLVKLPNGEDLSPEKDHGAKVKKGSETKSKEEIPEPRQNRWCCKIPSFLFLLMVLFYLGLCYLAWSSLAATTAERNLWTRVNSAPTHSALLRENGSQAVSALSDAFGQRYRKM